MIERSPHSRPLAIVWLGLQVGLPFTLLTVLLGAALLQSTSCGLWDESAPGARPGGPARTVPDDDDPGALVPVGVQTVIDVDMAQLRSSPWVTPALGARDQRARAAKAEALGYDDVDDVDRVIFAVTTAGAEAPSLVIARGRFQPARIEEAFHARWPSALAAEWHGIRGLASGENAMVLLTPRTFISGAPATIRAVIDRAFGIGADVGADPALGPTRRALCPEGRSAKPAILAAIAVDDRFRARVGEAAPVPRELREIGVRLDVGQSLELRALGLLDHRQAANALARRLNAMLTDPATRIALRVMGLGMLLTGTHVNAEGARVSVRVSVAEEHRATLSALLKTAIESSRGSASPSAFGSW